MARKTKPKKRASVKRERNAGTMSEAEFKSFIISALRDRTKWWKPITKTKAAARVKKGIYKCEKCGKEGPEHSPAPPGKKRRLKNFAVDHRTPIVGKEGFQSYDLWIERAFVEQGKELRLLCKECHDEKTQIERAEARAYKLNQN